jgi:hypothetical protein
VFEQVAEDEQMVALPDEPTMVVSDQENEILEQEVV